MTRSAAAVLVGIVLCTSSGCVKRERRGDAAVYAFEWWMAALVVLGSVAAVPAGLALRGRSGRYSFVLLVLSPVLAVFVLPGMVRDRVVIDRDHFRLDTGFWFAPTIHDVRFDDLREIRLVARERRTRGGLRKDDSLACRKKSGQTETVALGDLMKVAAPEVLRRADEKGVPITGLDQ